jgi:hypothetical protein
LHESAKVSDGKEACDKFAFSKDEGMESKHLSWEEKPTVAELDSL